MVTNNPASSDDYEITIKDKKTGEVVNYDLIFLDVAAVGNDPVTGVPALHFIRLYDMVRTRPISVDAFQMFLSDLAKTSIQALSDGRQVIKSSEKKGA